MTVPVAPVREAVNVMSDLIEDARERAWARDEDVDELLAKLDHYVAVITAHLPAVLQPRVRDFPGSGKSRYRSATKKGV